jgi:hypothetical protein
MAVHLAARSGSAKGPAFRGRLERSGRDQRRAVCLCIMFCDEMRVQRPIAACST